MGRAREATAGILKQCGLILATCTTESSSATAYWRSLSQLVEHRRFGSFLLVTTLHLV